MSKKTYQFQAEMEQLLELLAHSLYTNKEIFLRELISNASDTLNKIRFLSLTNSEVLGKQTDLKIEIEVDEKKKTISIEDNGMGMTEKELQENIGTIAKSGTMSFLKKLKKDQSLEQIGKFGVGFYSVFMVTEKVVVETKNYKTKQAYRWISEGKNSFTVEPIEKKTRGTKISFVLKKEEEDFANIHRIENIVKRYSNFVSFPILVNKSQKNEPTAIWRKPKSEIKKEEYKEFFQHLSHNTKEPLFTLHYAVEAPVQFQALLFASSEKEQNPFHPEHQDLNRLHLYIKRVFIQDDCKGLTPKWLRFLYGVVDTEDLPLNVSREVTQNSPVITKISQLLTKKIISEFQKIHKADKEKFHTLWENFGMFIKEGIYGDYENKEKLLEIYYLHSSKSPDKLISLNEIVQRKKPETKEIYYIHGKNKTIIEANPNTEYFAKQDIEILYLYEEVDEVVLPAVGEYQGVQFLPIDRAKLEENKKEGKKDAVSSKEEKFLLYLKDILADKVSDVLASQRLVQSPCSLVAAKDSMNPSMERMMQMMQKDFEKPKKILEVNLENPLIKQLQAIRDVRPQDALVKDIIHQLYDNAKLLEDSLEQAESMVPRLQKMMLDYAKSYLKKVKESSV
jgi:molecular chaperone HtpG